MSDLTISGTVIAPVDAQYIVVSNDATLTLDRRLSVNATNLTITDGGANNAITLNTIQDISITSVPTFERLIISGSTNQNFINASGTLDGTLAEIAYTLSYVTNKASGADTGLLISMTDSASPSVSLPLDIQVGGVSKLSVTEAGLLTSVNQTITAFSTIGVVLNSAAGVLSTLAPGTSGNVLTSNGTSWVSSPSAGGGAPVGAQYVTLATDGTLTNERVLTGTANQIVVTDNGAGSTVVLSTPQNIHTAATPTFAGITISGSTTSNFINASGTLDNATGDETAYQLNYTTNKLTSGTDTGLYVNQTDTSSPGISYLINLCRNGGSVFNITNDGNLTTSATVWTLATLTSFTMQNILAQPLLYADASSFKIKTNPVYIEMAAATSGTPAPSLTTTCPAHTGMTAATEMTELLIDMSSIKQWTAGAAIPNQRSLKILAPLLTTTAASTITEASTIYISGPPAISGFSAQITTSIGFKLDTRVLSSGVATGIGFQVYAPTGALTNACGSFMGGNVGINSLSPKTWLDIRVTDINSTNNVVTCLDGIARYIGTYIGGTAITTAPASNTSVFLMDFGWAPTANSAFIVGTNQSFFTLQGSVNTTGNVRGVANAMFLDTTGTAQATQFNGIISAVQSTAASTGGITTARGYLTSSNYAGTGTITTHVAYDASFGYTNVAGVASTTIGMRIGNVSKGAAYTLTDFFGVQILDQTAAFGGNKIGFYQLGTNLVNRLVGDTAIGVDANPGATLDVAGKFYVAGATGTFSKYNNQTTSGTGVGYILQGLATSATKTANFTVFSYTPAASAQTLRVYGVISTTSATNTGTVQFTLDYKDSNGTTHTADIIPLVDAAGASATTRSGASKEFHMIPWLFTIDATATAVALKVVITGTVSYTVTAALERVI